MITRPGARIGPWRTALVPSFDQGPPRPRRRIRRLGRSLAVLGLVIAAGAWAATRERVPRGVAPESVRVVRDVSLADTRGRIHGLAEWRDRRAVVLLFLGTECPISNGLAPEMAAMASAYGPRRVAFLGIHPDPDVTAEVAGRHAAEYGLNFPILLDPAQELAAQAGVTHTPEAVVLDGDRRILYRGRIDDRFAEPGKGRAEPAVRDLRAALDAILAGKAVPVAETKPVGCPLPRAGAPGIKGTVTYNAHVAPILDRKCAGCHRPGAVGPFALRNYKDAARRADFLRDVTESRRMPPWKPEPGFGTFLDDPRLTDDELATLARWAETGAAEGDPADRPPPPAFPEGWQLGTPDLVYELPEPFPVPAGGPDLYRAFVIPLPPGEDHNVLAFEYRPGNRRVVHHAKLYLDPTDASRRRDRADPGPGFPVAGGTDIAQAALWEWTPGTIPRDYPEGSGKILKAGSDLVLFVHYHPGGKPESDRSQVGIHLSKVPLARELAGVPMGATKIDIPAGVHHHEVAVSAVMPTDAHAYAVLPHAHYLLRELKVRAVLPDGAVRRLLWIKDWDLNWQGQYTYAAPVPLPRGTRIDLVGIYDNSESNPRNPSHPPRRVRFGPTSTDEMLGCHIQVIPDRPEGYAALRKKWPSGF